MVRLFKNISFYGFIMFILALIPNCGFFNKPQPPNPMFLPINTTLKKGEQLNLKVRIPENFNLLRPLHPVLNEFAPKNETLSSWTEIITTQTITGSIPGTQRSSKQMVLFAREGLLNSLTNVNVIEEFHKDYKTYKMSTLVMAYDSKGRREVVRVLYYSGPKTCSGVLYTVALSPNLNESDAIKKIKKFAETNTSIVTF